MSSIDFDLSMKFTLLLREGGKDNYLKFLKCLDYILKDKKNIPKDFSIFGFDNSITSINLKPSLSSLQLPIAEMTSKAVQHIFDDKSYDENFKIFVNCDLIKRNSI